MAAKKHIVATSLLHNCLGTSVADLSQHLTSAPSWESFVHDVWGPSYLASTVQDILHTAASYLQCLCNEGAKFNMDYPPWDAAHIATCAVRGLHPSANLHHDFLHEEYANFIDAIFWVVLPLDQIQALNKDLHLSPMAVKVEHNCQPCVLVDHTWFGVNEHTIHDLPCEVMQFSGMLPWLLWLIQHADPAKGPLFLSKYDLMDGFYHICLAPDDALKVAVMMPCYNGETQLAAMPLSLTMGWTKLPPMFSAASETATDLTNAQLTHQQHPLLHHHLEYLASAHDNWDPPSVMLTADTAILIAGNTPSVMLKADTTTLAAGIDPSLMPTHVPPCKPEPTIRLATSYGASGTCGHIHG